MARGRDPRARLEQRLRVEIGDQHRVAVVELLREHAAPRVDDGGVAEARAAAAVLAVLCRGQHEALGLDRARAIETQCFVLAAAQHGEHGRGRASFGHAAIIDPWGRVLAQQLDDCDAVLVADLDAQALLEARARIPTARHRLPPSRLAVQTVTLPT